MKQQKNEAMKIISARLPESLKARLDAEVERNRSSQSSEIIRALRAALEQDKASN